MLDYLSPAWVDRLREVAAADDELQKLAADAEDLTLQQVVTGAPSGSVAYYITLSEGEIFVQAGHAREADVGFSQDYATAVGVATGELNALDAVRDGRVLITGNPTTLTDRMDVMAALERVFADVRTDTTYPDASGR